MCTGRRLLHLRLAEEARALSGPASSPIVLDPYASEPLSAADLPAAERGGILAVDCSWNSLADVGHLPGLRATHDLSRRRRLPFLIATNPQHYGRLGELNTVEALGAALYVLGRPEEAAELLHGFAGGPAFVEVNHALLKRLAQTRTAGAVRQAERAFYGGDRASTGDSAPPTRSPVPPRRRIALR